MSKMPTLLELLKAGAHFGHQKSRWHPKMEQYLFGSRNGVHIIDLEKSLIEIEKVYEYVKSLAANGKLILFVGTKRQSREIIQKAAESCEMPYATERWIGGLLTNFDEVKKRLKKYSQMKEEVRTGEVEKYTKKEQVEFRKELEKMDVYLSGLVRLEKMPEAVYIADMRTEKTAIAEAQKTGVKIVGVCDSNVNPEKADYIIPANDDAVNAIRILADLMAEAVNEGKKEWEKKKAEIKEEKTPVVIKKTAHRVVKKEESI
ncbi:MAG TPA: 30S ribosomal protein S2 [Candidatus Magasanikbacteria bacterium]|nr:30S ribosomal protein S2 [Candidatus Magasanikbacteria bacterium]